MAGTEERYMLFRAGGGLYAVDVSIVGEISGMMQEHPIPDAPRFIRGVVNIHGTVAPVLDLSMYFGKGVTQHPRSLLLLQNPEATIAVMVEQMERMITAEEVISRSEATGASAVTLQTISHGTALLLDLQLLLREIETAFAV